MDGLEVITASDGIDALDKVKSFAPDIILLDIMMPKMDGFEVCKRLKEDELTKYIPVVMLTARDEIEDRINGLDAGAEDYIAKPFNLSEVSARVKSLLRMRAMQWRLREVEKMAALGEMVDGVAHEIRNPLMTIGGMARRLYDKETDEEHKGYAMRIIKDVERLERMVQRIDEYKGVFTPDLREGDLSNVVKEALDELTDIFTSKAINVVTTGMDDPPPIVMDKSNLKLAIYNILHNSADAIEKSGKITIETRLLKGDYIELRIEDDGCGMDQDFLRNIFNPFHTSKTQGAGLGLTISYEIVKSHKGEISVDSILGKGTTFTIKFPIVKRIHS